MKSDIQKLIYIGSNTKIPHRLQNKVDAKSIHPYMAYLEIRESPTIGGRGVFALRDFDKNEYVELCHVIHVPKDNIKEGSILHNYVFVSDKSKEYSSLALGYGMLYNHSNDPNLAWTWYKGLICFWALKKIYAGSELFHSYGKNWWTGREKGKK